MSKTCAELFAGMECTILGNPDEKVEGLAYRSDCVRPGDMFFCIVGLKVDGHSFAQDAINRGAQVLFVERKLYPNVDFYTGLIYQAMGFPTEMFTVLFAIGRLPGWIAHWREMIEDPDTRIGRPRQVYTGPTERDFVALDQRG